ncbi:hypothetical protein JX266_013581 [Neoarthrinium moseri]|nr:hypothetical protein JX266_013581 [Neoarthrinium moseri]
MPPSSAPPSRLETLKDRLKLREHLSRYFSGDQSLFVQSTPASELPNIRNLCVMCDKPGQKKCGKCNQAAYCSRECQVADWPQHKALCKTFGDFAEDKRPSNSHVRAILFPAADDKPRFIWLEQKIKRHETVVMLDKFLDSTSSDTQSISINNALAGMGFAPIGHGLGIISQSNEAGDNIKLTKSIMSLGKAGHLGPWYGNHAVIGLKHVARLDGKNQAPTGSSDGGRTGAIQEFEAVHGHSYGDSSSQSNHGQVMGDDVNFRDFRHSVDAFQGWFLNYCIVNPVRYHRPVIPALLIHCDGCFLRFSAFGALSPVQKVQVPVHILHEFQAFIEQEPATGPQQVGLEWFTRRFSPQREFVTQHINKTTLNNAIARYLVPTDGITNFRRNAALGMSPNCIDIAKPLGGSTLLFDGRGAPIDPVHLYALNDFLASVEEYQPKDIPAINGKRDIVPRLWINHHEHGAGKGSKPETAFKAFWSKWKKEKLERGVDLSEVPSPYDISGILDHEVVYAETLTNKIFHGAHH